MWKRRFRARHPSNSESGRVKTKLWCETSLKKWKWKVRKQSFHARYPSKTESGMWKRSFRVRHPSKTESGRCENEAFVQDIPKKVTVETLTAICCGSMRQLFALTSHCFDIPGLWHPFALIFLCFDIPWLWHPFTLTFLCCDIPLLWHPTALTPWYLSAVTFQRSMPRKFDFQTSLFFFFICIYIYISCMYTYTRFIDLGMVEEAGPSGGEMWRNPLFLRDCRLVPQSPFRESWRCFG